MGGEHRRYGHGVRWRLLAAALATLFAVTVAPVLAGEASGSSARLGPGRDGPSAPPGRHLPDGAEARLGHGTLKAMAASANGETLVVGGGIGVHVYDGLNPDERWLEMTDDRVLAVAVSADGTRVAARVGDRVSIWDARRGTHVITLRQEFVELERMAFDARGTRLATADEQSVAIWDTFSGHLLNAIEMDGFVTDIVWSPDGQTLALGSQHVSLWSPSGKNPVRDLQTGGQEVGRIMWSADGSTLAATLIDGTNMIWPLAGDEIVHAGSALLRGASSAALSPDGALLATGAHDGTIRLWDTNTGEEVRTLAGHADRVAELAFMPGGRLISAGVDNLVLEWDVETGAPVSRLEQHSAAATSVAWSPDGQTIAVGGIDGTVSLWDAGTAQRLVQMQAHEELVSGLAWSPDSSLLATFSNETTALLWDASTGELVQRLDGQPEIESATSGIVLDRGITIDGGTKWDGEIVGHTDPPLVAIFSHNGARVATGGRDSRVILWDVATGQAVHVLEGHLNHVNGIVFAPDDTTLVTTSSDGTLAVWDGRTGALLSTEQHLGQDHILVTPDASLMVSVSGGGRPLIQFIASSRVVYELAAAVGQVIGLQLSPDYSLLATGVQGDLATVNVWNTVSGELLKTLDGHSFDVTGVAFSPDGTMLASASWDGSVLLWGLDAE